MYVLLLSCHHTAHHQVLFLTWSRLEGFNADFSTPEPNRDSSPMSWLSKKLYPVWGNAMSWSSLIVTIRAEMIRGTSRRTLQRAGTKYSSVQCLHTLFKHGAAIQAWPFGRYSLRQSLNQFRGIDPLFESTGSGRTTTFSER